MNVLADFVQATWYGAQGMPVRLRADEEGEWVKFTLSFPPNILQVSADRITLVVSVKNRRASWERPTDCRRRFKRLKLGVVNRFRRLVGERCMDWPGATGVFLQEYLRGSHGGQSYLLDRAEPRKMT